MPADVKGTSEEQKLRHALQRLLEEAGVDKSAQAFMLHPVSGQTDGYFLIARSGEWQAINRVTEPMGVRMGAAGVCLLMSDDVAKLISAATVQPQ